MIRISRRDWRRQLSLCCFRYRRGGLAEPELDELNNEIARRLRGEGDYVRSTTRVRWQVGNPPHLHQPSHDHR